jgi:hypothetical protein
MRVSARSTDPDYIPDHVTTDVFLDGKRASHVVWADDQTGEVGHYVRDPETREFRLTPDGKDLAVEISRGQVEIVRNRRP